MSDDVRTINDRYAQIAAAHRRVRSKANSAGQYTTALADLNAKIDALAVLFAELLAELRKRREDQR